MGNIDSFEYSDDDYTYHPKFPFTEDCIKKTIIFEPKWNESLYTEVVDAFGLKWFIAFFNNFLFILFFLFF
jgi:hypothetical protein